MEVGGTTIVQKIKLSLMNDGVTMAFEEEPLLAYEKVRRGGGNEPSRPILTEQGINSFDPPAFVSAESFLKYWRADMESVPPGWYHFTNEEGMEVFIDNATGSGHIKAFSYMEDGIDWIENIRREMCRSHSDIASRGMNAFADAGFDGRGTDGSISTCTIPAMYQELDKLLQDHGWMTHASEVQWDILFNANDCGWPVEHIASMILMCSDIEVDYMNPPDPGFAMERKKIQGVLTQYRDYHRYELACIDRRFEKDRELDLDIQPPGEQPAGRIYPRVTIHGVGELNSAQKSYDIFEIIVTFLLTNIELCAIINHNVLLRR